jgi:hypothetical protein
LCSVPGNINRLPTKATDKSFLFFAEYVDYPSYYLHYPPIFILSVFVLMFAGQKFGVFEESLTDVNIVSDI